MFEVYSCIVEDHDITLVVLAALICALSSIVSFQVYGRARASSGWQRYLIVGTMGVVAGLGTWATHFIAMLAFQPGMSVAYDPVLTLSSLVIAVLVMTCGSLVALLSQGSLGRLLGGALVGLGVAAMHYTGMLALLIPGRLTWHGGYVIVSLGLAMGLAATAFAVAGGASSWRKALFAAGVLTLAIASLHFTGMTAVTIEVDPRIIVPGESISSNWLAACVAASTLFVLCIGAVGVLVDWRARRGEQARLRDFANAAVEGLVICDDGLIVDANRSFCALFGSSIEQIKGVPFSDLISSDNRHALMAAPIDTSFETALLRPDDALIPVLIVKRELGTTEGQSRVVYAIRDVREQKEAERRIRFLAHHDALTGLPNRVTFARALTGALAKAKEDGTKVSVLCIDLDHFKNVNDLHGHQAGDEVLVEAARRMRAALDDDDVLARLGGDEFAVVRSGASDHVGAPLALAERLIAALSTDFEVTGGSMVVLGTSIGLAIGPDNGADPERLLASADMALYRAKSEGRGRFRCFEQAMDTQVRERYALAAELRRAILHGELTIFYQPQVKAATGDLVGFEALVRWQHPVRGLIPPGDFIPLAEESGQIVALGEWVLKNACAEAARWTKPLKIAVNLSPIQFQQQNLPEIVHQILLETGLHPARLELEITESVLINDMSRALSILRRLKALGVRIAMDDFGTGYSSLATLQAFPFDKIKIDRSFVSKLETQPQAAVIVRAVLGLGRSLGIGVVAEGVETAMQLQFLADEACDEVQGYLFGKPQPIEQFAGSVQPDGSCSENVVRGSFHNYG